MRPNTPHAVFTTEHSIVLGGHFYSFTNLQDTVSGIIHCFCVDNMVTNTEHPPTRVLLLRMMQCLYKFFVQGADPQSEIISNNLYTLLDVCLENQAKHLPDLTNILSLVDVLALCNYCILANVLDCNTYSFPNVPYGQKASARHLRLRVQYDYNALSPAQRQYFSYVRGLAVILISWITSHYEITSTVESDLPAEPVDFQVAVAGSFLIKQALAILNYKRRAETQDVSGVPNCRAVDVQRQLELLFSDNPTFSVQGIIDLNDDLSAHDSFAFGNYTWRVRKRDNPLPFEGIPLSFCLRWLSL